MIRDPARAAALLQPMRRDLLDRLREPNSAAGLARQLNTPRQRLNHHLRRLEEVELVRFVDERRRGNCLERRFQATARGYLISPEALGALAPPDTPTQERFSWARLVTLAGRTLRDLATLRRQADAAGKHLATFSLETRIRIASPKKLAALTEAITQMVGEVVAAYHDQQAPTGRDYRLVLGSYPAPTEESSAPVSPSPPPAVNKEPHHEP